MIDPGTSTAATAATAAQPAAPTPSGGWFAQLARLVRWELFLAWRRRAMMITLGSLLLAGYILVVLVEYLVYYSSLSGDGSPASTLSDSLSFPGALGLGGTYITAAGVLFFAVLAGALIGSEYSYSTLRLSLARGVGRGQLLAAQILALALMALLLAGAMLGVSSLVGAMGYALGLRPATAMGTGSVVVEVVIYWLAIAFNIFAYSLISVLIGTLTRSVAGAIAGPLVFIVIEVVSGDILTTIGDIRSTSATLRLLGEIPHYLMGMNTGTLVSLAGSGPYPFTAGEPVVGAPHALVVSLVYCTLFIFISYVALRYRDIVE